MPDEQSLVSFVSRVALPPRAHQERHRVELLNLAAAVETTRRLRGAVQQPMCPAVADLSLLKSAVLLVGAVASAPASAFVSRDCDELPPSQDRMRDTVHPYICGSDLAHT